MYLYHFPAIRATSHSLQKGYRQEGRDGFYQRWHHFHFLSLRLNKPRVNIILWPLFSGDLWLQIHGGFPPIRVARINHVVSDRLFSMRIIQDHLNQLVFNMCTTATRRNNYNYWCSCFLRALFVFVIWAIAFNLTLLLFRHGLRVNFGFRQQASFFLRMFRGSMRCQRSRRWYRYPSHRATSGAYSW